jgi:hypothetical protein
MISMITTSIPNALHIIVWSGIRAFSHAGNSPFYTVKHSSGPDEFCRQHRQTDGNHDHSRSWQYDHGYSDSQDRKADDNNNQAFSLPQCFENKMLHTHPTDDAASYIQVTSFCIRQT